MTPTFSPPNWPSDWLAPITGTVRIRLGVILGAGELVPHGSANAPRKPVSLGGRRLS